MKKEFLLFLLILLVFHFPSFAQNVKDSSPAENDTAIIQKKKIIAHPKKTIDTVNKEINRIPVLTDTFLKKQPVKSVKSPIAQNAITDTSRHKDTAILTQQLPISQIHDISFSRILAQNKFLNLKETPVFVVEEPRNVSGKEFLFYSLCVVLLILGIFKTVFRGYFKNLFRVYFNTSLRQTQLSDQLEQAKLPSFILNIFFAITAGIYIWLLFHYYHPPRLVSSKLLLPVCILSVAALYFVKFCLLKFMGWVSELQQTTNKYIFAIFLVNKITGIILVPVIILLSFSNPSWRTVITNGSFIVIGLFFLSRYFKSYGALDKKVRINPFHFIIYIAAAEIIPLLLIYKVAVDYFI
ncbi:MAG: DUF4271 domain-containing protein [Ginsengibacter sp.]